jgi:hypothetical protein
VPPSLPNWPSRPAASNIVARGVLPDHIQQHLTGDPALSPALHHNQGLTADVWAALYRTPRLPAGLAISLVARPLTTQQTWTVLDTETRLSVLEAMYHHTNLPAADQQRLLDRTDDPRLRAAWWLNSRYDTSIAGELARRTGPAAIGLWLADPRIPAGDVGPLMHRFPQAWNQPDKSDRLENILSRHPVATPIAATSHVPSVRRAVIGSRHLHDPAVQARVIGLDTTTGFDPQTAVRGLLNPALHPDVRARITERASKARSAKWAADARHNLNATTSWTTPATDWSTETTPEAIAAILDALTHRQNAIHRTDWLTALAGNPHVTGDNLQNLTHRLTMLYDLDQNLTDLFTATHPRYAHHVRDALTDKRHRNFNDRRDVRSRHTNRHTPAFVLAERNRHTEAARWLTGQLADDPADVWTTVLAIADDVTGTLGDLLDAGRLLHDTAT